MYTKKTGTVILSSIALIFLILDSSTAISGAQAGIDLCIKSAIPSLFPFITISILLMSGLSGLSIHFITKLFHIPEGSGCIILSGLLGGYPIGAQCINHAYQNNQLSKSDAQYMLTFCNQAGPSLIFGILSAQFPHIYYAWTIWIIQLISALCVARSQAHKSTPGKFSYSTESLTLPFALKKAVSVMSLICGWIILFRIFLSFADRWILWILPERFKPVIYGILELSNGLLNLSKAKNVELRFVIASILLSSGGLCIMMQTSSVLHGLSVHSYRKGKLLQSVYSFLLAITAIKLFPESPQHNIIHALILSIFILTLPSTLRKTQKRVEYMKRMMYNNRTRGKKDAACCLERKSSDPVPTVSMVPN